MVQFADEHRTARKEHRCSDCGRVILVGETYRRGALFLDGTASSWVDCAHCDYVQRTYGDHVTLDDGAYNADSFYGWAYDGEALALAEARMMAGYRHQWRTRQGNLWPIPDVAS